MMFFFLMSVLIFLIIIICLLIQPILLLARLISLQVGLLVKFFMLSLSDMKACCFAMRSVWSKMLSCVAMVSSNHVTSIIEQN